MEHKAQETYDATSIIRFLEATSHNEEPPDERSLASRLCAECLTLFEVLMKTVLKREDPTITKSRKIGLERSLSRLKLWSDGYEVLRGDLDDILERSSKLRTATLELLGSIGSTLTDRLVPQLTNETIQLAPEQLRHLILEVKTLVERTGKIYDDSSLSDFSSDFGDDFQEIVEDLQTDTSCLMELDPLFKSPVLDMLKDRERSAPYSDIIEWTPHKAYSDMVESRFPEAANWLIIRLGKANYERYIRCQQERNIHELANDKEDTALFPAAPATIDGSKFYDSGLGSTLRPASSYAETIMSYGRGDGSSIRVPPLPPDGKAGKPFICVACGKSVLLSNNQAWKQHLYADLCPWLCLIESCSYGAKSFRSRNDWISHLELDHSLEPRWESFLCPLCHNDTGDGKIAIIKHLGGHLEEISLSALPSGIDLENVSEDPDADTKDVNKDIDKEERTYPVKADNDKRSNPNHTIDSPAAEKATEVTSPQSQSSWPSGFGDSQVDNKNSKVSIKILNRIEYQAEMKSINTRTIGYGPVVTVGATLQ
ncbi:hypothetical protein BP5796_03072 [Coleophoma crateriformis]|uniref:Oxidoreductase acuF-like C2H2 type zinc-finger domain-containing protein n=1 Tax=Coleophoma crateriformis TaxID=565419 RepID=A0A3D8SNJ8_9HELO|nr:hypothetical protein BP5796_03072 [Coleophoma crateriformis]